MERKVSFDEISDGRLYELNDMVKADCNGCKGCSACCLGMGNSIVLDPLDIFMLGINLNKTFEELLMDIIELNVVDGIILPNLKMTGASERCVFLNIEGRCNIHAFRPGICRLFPLGRIYEEQGFKYFLQVHECNKSKSKIKVSKWLDIPDIKNNERFVTDWHYFQKNVQNILRGLKDDNLIKEIIMYILKCFYMKPYDKNINFYEQFEVRLKEAKERIIKDE